MTENLTNHGMNVVEDMIFTVRDQKVILDADIARIYGVPTKRLNEQVRRNIERFPSDFMFRLTPQEATDLKSKFATSTCVVMRSQTATASKRNIRYTPAPE